MSEFKIATIEDEAGDPHYVNINHIVEITDIKECRIHLTGGTSFAAKKTADEAIDLIVRIAIL